MSNKLLRQGAQELDMELDEEVIRRFEIYLHLLQLWGGRINLTSIRDPEEVVVQHFLDSLAVARVLRPLLREGTLLDVGSGAGFPGAVCALVHPTWQVTLVERRQRKAAFLMTLRRELGLGIRVLAVDVRQVQGMFEGVVSRAAFPVEEWLEVGAARVAPGGNLLAMLSHDTPAVVAPHGFVDGTCFTYDLGVRRREIRSWRRVGTV